MKRIVWPISLPLALAMVALSFASPPQEPEGDVPRQPAAVFLVRHAETEASTLTERDPDLSPVGQERAAALARLLRPTGVTHLFATEYQRTQQTLQPLAESLELTVQVLPAGDFATWAERLSSLPPGAVAVVAGHSNTVPRMVAQLGEPASSLTDGSIAHDQYGRLFLVWLPTAGKSAPRTLEMEYGS